MSHTYDPVDDELDEGLDDEAFDDGLDDGRPGDEDDDAPITVEERARAMGWKPLAEYKGDPRRWTTAEEFIQHGEEQLPILRDQTRRMSDRLARQDRELNGLRTQVEQQAQAIKDAVKLARNASDAGYRRALDELKTEQRVAVREGDEEAFDAVQAQIDAMEAERRTVVASDDDEDEPPPAPREPAPAPQAPEIQAFIRDNAWFNDIERPYLRNTMVALHDKIIREGQIQGLGPQLAEARKRLAATFPDDFPGAAPAARRRAAPSALAPSAQPLGDAEVPGQRKRDPFMAIGDPTEREQARKAFEGIKANDPGFTAAEYMQMYDNPHIDALELRRQRKR